MNDSDAVFGCRLLRPFVRAIFPQKSKCWIQPLLFLRESCPKYQFYKIISTFSESTRLSEEKAYTIYHVGHRGTEIRVVKKVTMMVTYVPMSSQSSNKWSLCSLFWHVTSQKYLYKQNIHVGTKISKNKQKFIDICMIQKMLNSAAKA